MSYLGEDFTVCDVGEVEVYCIDFVNDLPTGDTLISAVWACSVSSGTDPNPSARLSGVPQIFNPTKTTQLIIGGLAGVSYILQAVVQTTQGNTLSLWSRSRVEYLT